MIENTIDPKIFKQIIDIWLNSKEMPEIANILNIPINSVWEAIKCYRSLDRADQRRLTSEHDKKRFIRHRVNQMTLKILRKSRMCDYHLVIQELESIVTVHRNDPTNLLNYLRGESMIKLEPIEIGEESAEIQDVSITPKYDMNDRMFHFTALLEGEELSPKDSNSYDLKPCSIVLNRMSARKLEFYKNRTAKQEPVHKAISYSPEFTPKKQEKLDWRENPEAINKLNEIYDQHRFCSHADRMFLIDEYDMMNDEISEWFRTRRGTNLKKKRLFNESVRSELKEVFKVKKFLTNNEQRKLSEKLGLTKLQVRKWFYNNRRQCGLGHLTRPLKEEEKEIPAASNKIKKKSEAIRTRFQIFEDVYKDYKFVSGSRLKNLALLTNQAIKTVSNWFWARRKRDKKLAQREYESFSNNSEKKKLFVLRSSLSPAVFIPKSIDQTKTSESRQAIKRHPSQARLELEKSFENNRIGVSKTELDRLQKLLGLNEKQIQSWFSHKRRIERMKRYNSFRVCKPTSRRQTALKDTQVGCIRSSQKWSDNKTKTELEKSFEQCPSGHPDSKEVERLVDLLNLRSDQIRRWFYRRRTGRIPQRNIKEDQPTESLDVKDSRGCFKESIVKELMKSLEKFPKGPTADEMSRICDSLNLTKEQVRSWFGYRIRNRKVPFIIQDDLKSNETTVDLDVKENRRCSSKRFAIIEDSESNEATEDLDVKDSRGFFKESIVKELMKSLEKFPKGPTADELSRLCDSLNLTKEQVRSWFGYRIRNKKVPIIIRDDPKINTQPMDLDVKDSRRFSSDSIVIIEDSKSNEPTEDLDVKENRGCFEEGIVVVEDSKSNEATEDLDVKDSRGCFKESIVKELMKSLEKFPKGPTADELSRLCDSLNLTKYQVRSWFSYRIRKRTIPMQCVQEIKIGFLRFSELSEEVRLELKKSFRVNPLPDIVEEKRLASMLNLDLKKIQAWFVDARKRKGYSNIKKECPVDGSMRSEENNVVMTGPHADSWKIKNTSSQCTTIKGKVNPIRLTKLTENTALTNECSLLVKKEALEEYTHSCRRSKSST